MALVLPALLSTLCRQLPRARDRWFVGLLIWVGLLYFAFIPIALPALVRPFLADTPTSIDPSGVCRQEHVYSCGPAAAVTALLRLGVPAEEGAIGVGADTSPVTGTDPQMLTDTINRLYGRFGVHAEYRLFTDFADLTAHTPAIVSLRLSTAANHYVTVLGVRGNGVVSGDPLQGLTIIGRDQFEAAWYSAGIAVARAPPAVGSRRPDPLE
jgi:predicted double-glycine peptidase